MKVITRSGKYGAGEGPTTWTGHLWYTLGALHTWLVAAGGDQTAEMRRRLGLALCERVGKKSLKDIKNPWGFKVTQR